MEAQSHSQDTAKAAPADERNVEIKARVGSEEEFESRLSIAKVLTDSCGEIIEQRDVYFNSKNGRFKLRYLKPPARSQLVYYDRQNIKSPKLSVYNKIELDEPELMEKILTLTNGERGVVEKTRYVFMFGPARIHLDKVKQLGNFLEFEVCLLPGESIEDGQAKADQLIKAFDIAEEDLMTDTYFDEMENWKYF